MAKKKSESNRKYILAGIVALVAIVALVGLVVMLRSPTTQDVALSGEAIQLYQLKKNTQYQLQQYSCEEGNALLQKSIDSLQASKSACGTANVAGNTALSATSFVTGKAYSGSSDTSTRTWRQGWPDSKEWTNINDVKCIQSADGAEIVANDGTVMNYPNWGAVKQDNGCYEIGFGPIGVENSLRDPFWSVSDSQSNLYYTYTPAELSKWKYYRVMYNCQAFKGAYNQGRFMEYNEVLSPDYKTTYDYRTGKETGNGYRYRHIRNGMWQEIVLSNTPCAQPPSTQGSSTSTPAPVAPTSGTTKTVAPAPVTTSTPVTASAPQTVCQNPTRAEWECKWKIDDQIAVLLTQFKSCTDGKTYNTAQQQQQVVQPIGTGVSMGPQPNAGGVEAFRIAK